MHCSYAASRLLTDIKSGVAGLSAENADVVWKIGLTFGRLLPVDSQVDRDALRALSFGLMSRVREKQARPIEVLAYFLNCAMLFCPQASS